MSDNAKRWAHSGGPARHDRDGRYATRADAAPTSSSRCPPARRTSPSSATPSAGSATSLDVPDQTLADIKLAVTEACTNVVVHAYPDGEGPMGAARVGRRRRA